MRGKGQAAMEFLMTYGWAILVVLAAIGALAYLGVLSPGNLVGGRCSMSGSMTCNDVGLAAGANNLTLVVTAGQDIVVTDTSILSGTGSVVTCTTTTTFLTFRGTGPLGVNQIPDGSTAAQDVSLAAGQKVTVSGLCTSVTEGDKIDATVSFMYHLQTSTIPKTIKADIKNVEATA